MSMLSSSPDILLVSVMIKSLVMTSSFSFFWVEFLHLVILSGTLFNFLFIYVSLHLCMYVCIYVI